MRPTMSRRLIVLLGAPLLAIAVALGWYTSTDPGVRPGPERDIGSAEAPRDFTGQFTGKGAPSYGVVNGRAFYLEVASDAASRGLGLGGRGALAEDSGMLFVFPAEGFHSFWMRDVSFPLDLLYISRDGTIVDIQRMEPQPGVSDSSLTIYSPPVEVLLALEINGGTALRHGIETGMVIGFE